VTGQFCDVAQSFENRHILQVEGDFQLGITTGIDDQIQPLSGGIEIARFHAQELDGLSQRGLAELDLRQNVFSGE
jgi:hypothetical protein